MARPVRETVHFNVNVTTFQNAGKWVAVTLQTGIITTGETEQQATEAASRWNQQCIADAKQNGRRFLKKYLDARGITFSITRERAAIRRAEIR